ncbi:MAG: DUF3313 domain-containing protein [Nitrospiraceae bacterium]|nr:DUF3313 domain-containing protein [Nitrospiraceae bacterium]
MIRKLAIIAVAAVLLAAMSVGAMAAEKKFSGFLQNYKGLKEGPKDGAQLIYRKAGTDFAKYGKIMLDSVVFFLADDAEYRGISAEDMKELSDTFNKAAVDALGKDYPLVGEAGPDVMRVRVAITHLKPSKPARTASSTVMPMGLALSFVKKGVTGEYTGVGSTGIEVEFLDSLANERIGAAVDYKPGGKLSGFAKWSASKEAFEFWAGRLKTFLDGVHGKKQ